jgi:hypothetical protein
MTKHKRLGSWAHGTSPRLAPELRQEREQLADRAVKVLTKLGVTVHREEFGLRGGLGVGTWFVTLSDLHRYLVLVRDEQRRLMVLSRASAGEVQRTISTLGVDEEGWPVAERAEAVVDLIAETWTPLGAAR